ncbi:hypothetical protein J8657_06700 [Dickeya oryzae]|uniref:MFS transporter n=1 Tax=Dickeya oryzae TaxID=1240404 RepID=A0AB39IUW0_9GAMM|nr:hypothetical protein [Dickeya oryzae]MBP2857287.1 hypothetical protein [Dickeya oryzae]MCA6989322.1 hypothetical protein [Dickeya oryzae]
MSKTSCSCIVLLAFSLMSSFMVMPYLISTLAPGVGISVNGMTWGLGICNGVAALTLYIRPSFRRAGWLLAAIMALMIVGTSLILVGIKSYLPWVLIVGVAMMRIALVNYSDFNRQAHMQTNTERGIRQALSAANVVSNIISCTVPLAAVFILQKWGASALVNMAVFFSLCCATLGLLLFGRQATLTNIVVSGKPSPGNTARRFLKHMPLYLITLINSVIFAFIYSYIPLRLTDIPDVGQKYIAFYFTINSLVVAFFSFPIMNIIEKLSPDKKTIIILSSLLSLLSIFIFYGYNGNIYRVIFSSSLMAISEIMFLPFVVSLVASRESAEKEMIIRDITLISVSLSATLSSPMAGLIYQGGEAALVAFLIVSSTIVVIASKKLGENPHEK